MQGILLAITVKAPTEIRRANVGEYVKITEQSKASHINYVTGDIIKVTEITELGCVKGINQKDGKETGCISKYEYVVLENYQPKSEPEQPKEEFKPYLVWKQHNVHYGYIGEKTPFKDAIGRALRIGDTVELYNKENSYIGEFPIVAHKSDAPFVMSIQLACHPDGEISGGWKIILKRRYEDIKHGEKVDDITYMKER